MLPTALISAVLADIPTAIIFSGMAYTLLKKNNCMPGKSNFGKSIMIGIPIAAAIGGFGTPAGSGLNVLAISLIKSASNIDVNFLQWTIIGLPMAIVLVMVAWFVIKIMYPAEIDHVEGLDDVKNELKNLGPMTTSEKKFAMIFSVTVLLWLTQPFNKLDLAFVAIVTASVFFLPAIDRSPGSLPSGPCPIRSRSGVAATARAGRGSAAQLGSSAPGPGPAAERGRARNRAASGRGVAVAPAVSRCAPPPPGLAL